MSDNTEALSVAVVLRDVLMVCAGYLRQHDQRLLNDARAALAQQAPPAAQAEPTGDPLDMPLPCDVKIGHGTHRKGTSLRTLVVRAKHLFDAAYGPLPTPEQAAHNLAVLQGKAAAQAGDELPPMPEPPGMTEANPYLALGVMDPHAGKAVLHWYTADQMRAYALAARGAQVEPKHGYASVWHEGSRSFYRAALLEKMTHQDYIEEGDEPCGVFKGQPEGGAA